MQETKLAAIMFTDIAGYSRLMEEDEVRTISILHDHNEIVFPLIEKADGRIVDAIGDGLLVTFPSVLVAVRSAIEVQNAVEGQNEGRSPEQRFHLRIGVHLGEIWEEGDRVFGTGVNVAARVQPYAEPGGLCVSEDVYRQVSNKISLPVRSIGRPELKNISRSIELYRIETGHETEEESGGLSGGTGRSGSGGGRAADEPQADRSPAGALSAGGGRAFDGRSDDSIDAVKERILEERAKIAAKRKSGSSHSDLGQAIENRVFNVVDRAMDAAIAKWEKLPPEKRREALEAGRWHGEGSAEGHSVVVSPGRGKHRKENAEDEEKPGGDLIAGVVFGVGFGAGYWAFGIGWMIWPFLIIGVLPILSGLRKIVRGVAARRAAEKSRPQRLEQMVLRAARDLGGRVTVVQIASHTDLAPDDAQETLDRMCAKGYVIQDILDNGTVIYEFPALDTSSGSSTP